MLAKKEITFRPKHLYDHIEGFVVYSFDKPTFFHLLPLGKLQLFFQFDDVVTHSTIFTDGWKKRPLAFLAGPYNRGYQLKIEAPTKMFAIQFKPGKYNSFFKEPIYNFKNLLLSPETLWGKTGRELSLSIYHAKSHSQMCKIAESFLIKLYRESVDLRIDQSVQYIMLKQGNVSIKELASKAFLSDSQYRKRFGEEIGLSPKEFQRIIRLNAVDNFLRAQPSIPLTKTGYLFGFSDQSHFIKEYQSLTGMSPTRWLQKTKE